MTVFERFAQLQLKVPHIALMSFENEGSDFCNYTFRCKNSYRSVGSDFLEDSHYNYWGYHNKNSIDCSYCVDCEDCYECLDCKNCINASYLQDCADVVNSSYCFDCVSSRDCFACIGLFRKQYYVFNKAYSREEYRQKVEKLRRKSPEEIRKLFREVKSIRPHVYMRQNQNEGENTGDYVFRSVNCRFCFDADRCKESLYLNNAINCVECVDISFAGEPPLQECYEIMSGMGLKNCAFCNTCWHGQFLEYCELCFRCEYCFLCVGLRNRRFHIFNEPYEPKRYFEKVRELKEQMKREGSYGKWFPSVYPLEDTIACEDFPCIKHELEKSKGLEREKKLPRLGPLTRRLFERR